MKIFLLILILTLSSCGSPPPPPPTPCHPADNCVIQEQIRNHVSCKGTGGNEDAIVFYNKHPDKNVIFNYEGERRHSDSPLPVASIKTYPTKIENLKRFFAGCHQYLHDPADGGPHIDENSYTKIAACFEGACPDSSSEGKHEVPTEPRPPDECIQLCTTNDPKCIKASLENAPDINRALSYFHNELSRGYPNRFDLDLLEDAINKYNNDDKCVRTDFVVGVRSNPYFDNTGTSCSFRIANNSTLADVLGVELPGQWRGIFEKSLSDNELAMIDSSRRPVMTLEKDGKTTSEKIIKIESSWNKILLTGESLYCAEITYSGG